MSFYNLCSNKLILYRWWGQKVKSQIKKMKLDSKVSLYIVPNNKKYDQKRHGDGDEDQFRSYINFAAQLNTTFDLVIDDGRARVPVRCEILRSLFKNVSWISYFSKVVLESRLLSSNSSVLVIHDWERPYYKTMVTDIGYR